MTTSRKRSAGAESARSPRQVSPMVRRVSGVVTSCSAARTASETCLRAQRVSRRNDQHQPLLLQRKPARAFRRRRSDREVGSAGHQVVDDLVPRLPGVGRGGACAADPPVALRVRGRGSGVCARPDLARPARAAAARGSRPRRPARRRHRSGSSPGGAGRWGRCRTLRCWRSTASAGARWVCSSPCSTPWGSACRAPRSISGSASRAWYSSSIRSAA